MAFQYGISANLNVDKALTSAQKLIDKLAEAEKKASNLKVNISINNELVTQLKTLNDFSKAQKDVVANTSKQAQEQEKLNALEEKTAGIKQKNANQQKLAEEALAQAKEKTANIEKKNADDAAARQQKLSAQKKADDDAALAREEKLKQAKARTATEEEKAEQIRQRTADNAAKAEQNRRNEQRKADQAAEEMADRINEKRQRGEEATQQAQERTNQARLRTLMMVLAFINQIYRIQEERERKEQQAADAAWRRQQKIQKEERENNDAIARDLEKQARIEQAQREIEEQKLAKNRELREAIEENQKAQDNYNRVLGKALPTINEIRSAMQRLTASEEALSKAQLRSSSPLSFLIGKVGPTGSWGKTLRSVGGGISKLGELTQGFSQAYNVIQDGASKVTDKIWGVASGFFNKVTSGFQSLSQEGLEAFGTLEMAEIGFANFFDGSATEFTRRIKEAAVDMPMVGAADLARSVQYIAPLANGNSDLALSAVEGVMKSIVYSGNDVSQYGTKALQNLTQVASGNLTATDIKEMMRQMPALPRLLASTDTGSELLEGGQITTKAVKNYIAKYGSDAILGVFKEISEKSEASDIYDVANTTFKGAMEQLQEKVVLSWQDAFDNSGAANLFKDILNELSKKGGIIEQFAERVTHYARVVVNWFKLNENEIKQLMEEIGDGLGKIVGMVKGMAKEVLNDLGIMNGNKINTAKFKEIIQQVLGFIKGVVKGFGEGFKALFKLLDRLREQFGPEVFEKIGYWIGMLASPLGKLGSALGTFTSNGLRALGGVVDTLGRLFQTKAADGSITWTGKIAKALNMTNASSPIPKFLGNTVQTVTGGRVSAAGAATGVARVATGVGKAVKGIGVAALGIEATQAVKGIAEFAGATKEASVAINTIGSGASVAAGALMMGFGPGGAIIGAILGAVTGFVTEMNRQKELLYQKNADKSNKEIQEYLAGEGGKELDKVTEQVFALMEQEGIKIDRGSDSGKYAELMLNKKIQDLFFTTDENGKITKTDINKVMAALANGDLTKLAAGWYRDKEIKEATATLTESDAFLKAGGSVIDFKTDTEKRDTLAKFITRNWLNGDETQYDYKQNSAETIVRDYLQTIAPNGKQELTTEQYAMLFKTENERGKELEPMVRAAQGIDGLREDLVGLSAWDNVEWVAKSADKYGYGIWQTLRQINKDIIAINIKNGTYGQDSTNAFGGGNFIGQNTANAITAWRDKGAGGKFGGQSDDNKYTMQDGTRHYVASIQGKRDKMAEIYGKKKGDNDDFEETIKKMDQVASTIEEEIVKNHDNEEKVSALSNDYNELVRKRNELQSSTVGDWGALFKIQNELQDLMRKYGVQFRASGGIINALLGNGRGVDTVPAFLQPGEFVMRKSAVDKAGPSVFAALNRGDFAGAAHALGNKFHNSWDQSHHWSNQITTNNNNTSNNYFFAGGQVRGRRSPYRAMANRVATI